MSFRGEGDEWTVGGVVTSIGTQDGTPEGVLYGVFDATLLSDGTVVVANSGTVELGSTPF